MLWDKNPNLAVAARALKDPLHAFNAKEVVFIRKSVARNRRRKQVGWAIAFATVVSLMALSVWALLERATAEEEKERALLSLFEGLSLNMTRGNRAACACMGCATRRRPGWAAAWRSLGRLPDDLETFEGPPVSRIFAASRKFGWGSVLVYAQDGLTLDEEITDDSDNLLFVQNALAWLTPLELKTGCAKENTILAWDGTFATLAGMERVREFIERRGWVLQMARPETLETDLACAEVLWHLSDWEPPAEFADWHVGLIEDFVRAAAGSWSADSAGRMHSKEGRAERRVPLRRRPAGQTVWLRVYSRRVPVGWQQSDHAGAWAVAAARGGPLEAGETNGCHTDCAKAMGRIGLHRR